MFGLMLKRDLDLNANFEYSSRYYASNFKYSLNITPYPLSNVSCNIRLYVRIIFINLKSLSRCLQALDLSYDNLQLQRNVSFSIMKVEF